MASNMAAGVHMVTRIVLAVLVVVSLADRVAAEETVTPTAPVSRPPPPVMPAPDPLRGALQIDFGLGRTSGDGNGATPFLGPALSVGVRRSSVAYMLRIAPQFLMDNGEGSHSVDTALYIGPTAQFWLGRYVWLGVGLGIVSVSGITETLVGGDVQVGGSIPLSANWAVGLSVDGMIAIGSNGEAPEGFVEKGLLLGIQLR